MSQFERIAQEAIRKAERISCPLDEFADGLAEMAAVLQEREAEVRAEMAE